MGEKHEGHKHDHDHGHGHDHHHDHDHENEENVAVLAPSVEITEVGPWKRTLKIEVSADHVREQYEESLKDLTKTAQVPGFRKGHVPRARLLKQYGKPLADEVKVKIIGMASEEAMKGNDLEAISMPEMDVESLTLEPEQAFSFEFTVEIKPTFDLPEYKGLKLARKSIQVTDERIDGFINALRRDKADYAAIEDGGAEPGDRLTVSARLEIDGAEVWKTENDIAHLLDDLLLGISIPAKAEDVKGIVPGEERELDVVVPDSFKDEEHRGKPGKMFLKAEEIKRPQFPVLDDAAAQELGAEDVADLKARVRDRLERQAKSEEEEDLRTQIVDQLVEGARFDLPEGMLERETKAREMRQLIRMAQMGVKMDDLEERQRQEMVEGARASSERDLRASLILGKIAEIEKIEVGDEEVEEEVFRLAQSYGKTPVSVRSQLEREGRIEALREGLATGKVVNFLIEQADIKDAAGEPSAEGGDA